MDNWVQLVTLPLLLVCCAAAWVMARRIARLKVAALKLQDQLQEAQAQASQATQLLDDVAGASPLAIYASVMYPDGGSAFSFISPRTLNVIGVSPDDIRADPAKRLRFIVPEDQQRIMELRARNQKILEATGVAPPFEIEVQAEFGGRRSWVRIASMLLRVEPDKSSIWIGYFEDISARKAAELETQLAAKQQQSILEGATAGIAFVRDGVILRSNRFFDDLHRASVGGLTGTRTANLYVDPSVSEMNRAAMMEALQKGNTWQNEAHMRRMDNSVFWARISGRAVDAADMSQGSVWMVQDVTAERLAQDTLLKAKELAEESTRAKSDFLANMSHEIRTPMNAIIGMSQLALNYQLDDKARNYVFKANRAAKNLLGIINDILDFSKIEAGKLEMEEVAFDLEDVFDNLATLLVERVGPKPLELIFDVPTDLPAPLVGDPLRLGQVLVNLGSNAVKFTQQGSVVMGVETMRLHAGGVSLHFWVRDTGIGMTPAQCERLFQSFSQADASTTRQYGGTGLGLAISKNIVELMGGSICACSQPGVGSTFHFEVDFKVGVDGADAPVQHRQALQRRRVLVIDDSLEARTLLSHMLAGLGLQAECAPDAASGLELLAQTQACSSPFDLVLMDWSMPGMDGLACAAALQRRTADRVPPVVLLTSQDAQDALEQARAVGVKLAGTVSKPITPSRLLRCLLGALQIGDYAERRDAQQPVDPQAMEHLQGMRLLLVEDNEMNTELAVALLSGAGMTVVVAGNGQEALQILQGDSAFAAILMDCQMPVMDGYSATRMLRKNPDWQHLPVIAMTANALVGDRAKALESGMNDHIAKPLDVAEMFATIARWVLPGAAQARPFTLVPPPVTPPAKAMPLLDGINTVSGLARMQGNTVLYRKMLLRFAQTQSAFPQRLLDAQRAGDLERMVREAHTLRGTAGSIGATGTQAQAELLEMACEALLAGQDAAASGWQSAFDVTCACLQKALSSINSMEPAQARRVTPQADQSVDGIRTLLQRVLHLSHENDAEALNLEEAVRDAGRHLGKGQSYEAIVEALQAFDFDAVASKVEIEIRALGAAPEAHSP